MKVLTVFSLLLFTLLSSTTQAHHGPASIEHFMEHFLLSTAFVLPIIFLVRRIISIRTARNAERPDSNSN
jgi:hypothetical protein